MRGRRNEEEGGCTRRTCVQGERGTGGGRACRGSGSPRREQPLRERGLASSAFAPANKRASEAGPIVGKGIGTLTQVPLIRIWPSGMAMGWAKTEDIGTNLRPGPPHGQGRHDCLALDKGRWARKR